MAAVGLAGPLAQSGASAALGMFRSPFSAWVRAPLARIASIGAEAAVATLSGSASFSEHLSSFAAFHAFSRVKAGNSPLLRYALQSSALMGSAALSGLWAPIPQVPASLGQRFVHASFEALKLRSSLEAGALLFAGRLEASTRFLREYSSVAHLRRLDARSAGSIPLFRDEAASQAGRTRESQRLLDPFRESEQATVAKLLRRSIEWQVQRLKGPAAFLYKDDALREFGAMARFFNQSIRGLLQWAGHDAELYFPGRPEIEVRLANPLMKVPEGSLAYPEGLPPHQMRIDMRKFLDAAFHSRESVIPCLAMAKALGARLGYSWRGMLEDMQEHPSPTQRNALRYLVESPIGELPFDEFFEAMMFEGREGVYTRSEAQGLINQEGGFFSTPSEAPLLGQMLARSAFQTWHSLGRPSPFHVVEMGCGNGTLAKNLLGESRRMATLDSDWAYFNHALRYRLVDRSAALQKAQRRTLAAEGARVSFHTASAIRGSLPPVECGLFLSVELLDMFAPTTVTLSEGRLQEVFLSARGGLVQEVLRPLRPAVRDYLRRHPLRLAEGRRFYLQREIEPWLSNVRASLGRGSLLTIDYGASRQTLEELEGHHSAFRRYGNRLAQFGSLRRYSPLAAQLGFPFDETFASYVRHSTGHYAPMDMTADVDFSALEEAAASLPGVRPAPQPGLPTYLQGLQAEHPHPDFSAQWSLHGRMMEGFQISIQDFESPGSYVVTPSQLLR